MRALLVYPEYPETFWNFKYALRFIAKKASYPPLGLLTVAAMLPQDWELKLVDMNVTALRDEDLRWAEVVLISAMSIQQQSVREVIDRCKALEKTIVAGGPLFTATPDDFDAVDVLVLNEAEVTLPRYLHDLAHGQVQHLYTSTELADLHTTPIPRWDLINVKHYAALSIQTSRGCPYDCEFCNITTLFGRIPRMKSSAQVIAELDRLYALGWRSGVFFVDDNLIGQVKKVKRDLLPAIIAWMEQHKHPFIFNSQVPLTLADDVELLELLSRAGFAAVFVGIESPDAASLLECNKIPNKDRDLMASIRIIQQHGIQVQAGFIVGFDSDPVSIFERVVSFIQESGIVTAMVGLLNAPQGTRLYQRLQTEGRLLREMSGDNTDYSLNFTPKMNMETLLHGYRSIIERIYSPAAFYQRLKRFLREYRPTHGSTRQFKFTYLVAAVKMVVVLGVIEKERSYYWRLFFWSLFHKPRLLPLAITLTAYGFHFRKCFEQHLAVSEG